MSLTFKQLESFVWVADLGSFRRAADRMNTTQPNISARIAALEEALGQRLMLRDAGSVTLTPVGEEVLSHARRVLRAAEDLVLAAGDAGRLEGVLRLGVTEMIADTWLNRFLKRVQGALPMIQLELTVDRSAVLSDMLAERGLDLALQSAPFERAMTGTVPLGDYPFIWVAAPSLGPPDAQTLFDHPILTHARGTFPYDQLAAHLAGQFHGRARGEARRIMSSNLAACRDMAIAGMGVACLPAAMAQGDLAAGRLARVAYDWCPDPLQFAARYDAERAPGFVRAVAEMAVVEDQKFRSL